MYYKALKNEKVIDVLDHLVFVKYHDKGKIMVVCHKSEAQGIISSDGECIWHVNGLYGMPVDGYDTVDVVEIDEYEYKQLKLFNLKTPDDNKNVTVIRINRVDNINKMNILANTDIKKLWGNPILRYSNILSGLFHEKVVVCESDYDCLFYQAVMNAIYESEGEIAPDILFTHCGGKSRAKDVVNALRAVNVPVVAICDFDLLNSSQNFKPLVTAFGEEWNNVVSSGMQTIYNNMNAKNSAGVNAWDQIKKIGKAGFTDDAPAAYEKVEAICQKVGLFIVPVGEMEGFVKTVNKEKKDWVYHVLANYDLATDPKLAEARSFVQSVVDFKLT